MIPSNNNNKKKKKKKKKTDGHDSKYGGVESTGRVPRYHAPSVPEMVHVVYESAAAWDSTTVTARGGSGLYM